MSAAPSWAVLGPGGVGGLVAAALTRAGEDVVVVARPATARTIAASGIVVRSVALGDFTAHPAATEALADPIDVLVVATKSTSLDAALERVMGPVGVVVPLLNGVEHVAHLRARFGTERVLAASIRVESDRPEPGLVVQRSPGVRLELSGRADLAERLAAAGLPTRVLADEATLLWSKLCRLCPLALTTSASGLALGAIRSDPAWSGRLHAAVDECVTIAHAEGAELDAAVTQAELREAHPALSSSMARDVAAGRTTEIDAIAGAVLRAGARQGLTAPVVAALAARVAPGP